MVTWIRSKGGRWHWYNVKACNVGWALNDWSSHVVMQETEGAPPYGEVCSVCLSKLEAYTYSR